MLFLGFRRLALSEHNSLQYILSKVGWLWSKYTSCGLADPSTLCYSRLGGAVIVDPPIFTS